jgi:diadenylate cyclase
MDTLLGYLASRTFWIGFVELIIVAIIAFIFYKRFIKNTAAEKLVRGLKALLALWIISGILLYINLNILGLFFRWVALFLSVGLIVIFQPELRKFLGIMGKINIWRSFFSAKSLYEAKNKDLVSKETEEIAVAVEYMSDKKIGALIVFQEILDDSAVKNVGTIVNANISSELLLTIFFPKTSLHDGAVLIRNDRIYSAGAILPLTENTKLHWQYGTRHRAAIGITEVSDVYALVVSEETGNISIANNGKITKYDDMKKLRQKISYILSKK